MGAFSRILGDMGCGLSRVRTIDPVTEKPESVTVQRPSYESPTKGNPARLTARIEPSPVVRMILPSSTNAESSRNGTVVISKTPSGISESSRSAVTSVTSVSSTSERRESLDYELISKYSFTDFFWLISRFE